MTSLDCLARSLAASGGAIDDQGRKERKEKINPIVQATGLPHLQDIDNLFISIRIGHPYLCALCIFVLKAPLQANKLGYNKLTISHKMRLPRSVTYALAGAGRCPLFECLYYFDDIPAKAGIQVRGTS